MPSPLPQLIKMADYDRALELVNQHAPASLFAHTEPLQRLRLACMISDVLDYGGRYAAAREVIGQMGREAEQRLSTVRTPTELTDPKYIKQECWSLLMWGMTFYRRRDQEGYTEAMKRFELAKKILLMLKQSGVSCDGTLSRAWYCVGLVERQRREYRVGRAAFTRAVELAAVRIEACRDMNEPFASHEYHQARCYGLGLGWIAYDEAFLDEARAWLATARGRLFGKNARFINAYVNIVHACVLLSADSRSLAQIDAALAVLQKAYVELAPSPGFGHPAYAVRAANELAYAHLRRARLVSGSAKDAELQKVEAFLVKVKNQVAPVGGSELKVSMRDERTHSTVCILESRLYRQRNQPEKALAAAQTAKSISGGSKFSRIDAAIALGEAAYELRDYHMAENAFHEALDLGRMSPKVAAVCNLHLSRMYLASDRPSKALEHFNQWKASEFGVENGFIAELAKSVRVSLAELADDFILPHDLADLDPEKHIPRLRRWLVLRALARTSDDRKRAAMMLGLSLGALRAWLHGIDPQCSDLWDDPNTTPPNESKM